MLQRKFALIKRKLESYSIDDLTDVSLGTPSNGDILVWNGSSFVPGTHGDIGGLSDNDHPQYALLAGGTYNSPQEYTDYHYWSAGVRFEYAEIYSTTQAAQLWFYDGTGAVDEKWTDISNVDGDMRMGLVPDAGGTYKYALNFARTGAAWSAFEYGNATDNPTHTFRGYPTFHSAGMDIRSTSGWGIYLQDASAAVDTEWWSIESIGGTGTWRLFASNDAFSTERDALSFTRTAGAVTSQTYGNSTDNPTHQFHGEVRLGTDQPLRFDEHSSAAGTPATGNVYLYAKADGLLYSKDDAGTETLVSGGSGGSANFDDILTAGGEVLVDGSGNVLTI